jgi:hypothetical protein
VRGLGTKYSTEQASGLARRQSLQALGDRVAHLDRYVNPGEGSNMKEGTSRRQFLKACGATALAMTTVTAGRVLAANTIHFRMHGFDEERFGEESLLRKAMNLVADRLQKKRVWQNVYDVRPSRYNLTGGVMKNSNLSATAENKRNLLRHQLYWLSQPNDEEDEGLPFPRVHLRAFHEESDVLGRAHTDLVVVKSVGDRIRQSGEFDVYLNRYQLASGGLMDDPEEWASTIAHEMLHNLGHLHEKGDYSDAWQINVLNNAVLCNGYYRSPRHKWWSAHLV